MHAEPPVYIAHDFLSADDCAALRRAAEAGQLPYLAYDNAVLVDTHRLLLLLPVVAAGAGFDAWQALLAHSGAGGGGDAAVTAAALAAAAGPALLHWSAGVGLLVAAALGGMRAFVGGRVFTGGWRCGAGASGESLRHLHRNAVHAPPRRLPLSSAGPPPACTIASEFLCCCCCCLTAPRRLSLQARSGQQLS